MIYLPYEGSSNSLLASLSPAWVLLNPLGYGILSILLAALWYGKNLKLTVTELAKVTAAYLVLIPCESLANSIILLRAILPFLNSQLPIDPEPSITTTISSVIRELYRNWRPGTERCRKLVISLFSVWLGGGTFWNSANEIKKQFFSFQNALMIARNKNANNSFYFFLFIYFFFTFPLVINQQSILRGKD